MNSEMLAALAGNRISEYERYRADALELWSSLPAKEKINEAARVMNRSTHDRSYFHSLIQESAETFYQAEGLLRSCARILLEGRSDMTLYEALQYVADDFRAHSAHPDFRFGFAFRPKTDASAMSDSCKSFNIPPGRWHTHPSYRALFSMSPGDIPDSALPGIIELLGESTRVEAESTGGMYLPEHLILSLADRAKVPLLHALEDPARFGARCEPGWNGALQMRERVLKLVVMLFEKEVRMQAYESLCQDDEGTRILNTPGGLGFPASFAAAFVGCRKHLEYQSEMEQMWHLLRKNSPYIGVGRDDLLGFILSTRSAASLGPPPEQRVRLSWGDDEIGPASISNLTTEDEQEKTVTMNARVRSLSTGQVWELDPGVMRYRVGHNRLGDARVWPDPRRDSSGRQGNSLDWHDGCWMAGTFIYERSGGLLVSAGPRRSLQHGDQYCGFRFEQRSDLDSDPFHAAMEMGELELASSYCRDRAQGRELEVHCLERLGRDLEHHIRTPRIEWNFESNPEYPLRALLCLWRRQMLSIVPYQLDSALLEYMNSPAVRDLACRLFAAAVPEMAAPFLADQATAEFRGTMSAPPANWNERFRFGAMKMQPQEMLKPELAAVHLARTRSASHIERVGDEIFPHMIFESDSKRTDSMLNSRLDGLAVFAVAGSPAAIAALERCGESSDPELGRSAKRWLAACKWPNVAAMLFEILDRGTYDAWRVFIHELNETRGPDEVYALLEQKNYHSGI